MTFYTSRQRKFKLTENDVFIGTVYPDKEKTVIGITAIKTLLGFKRNINIYAKEHKPAYGVFYDCYDAENNLCGYVETSYIVLPLLITPVATAATTTVLVIALATNNIVPATNTPQGTGIVVPDIQVGELENLTFEQKKEVLQKLVDDSAFELRMQTEPIYKDGKLRICVENRDWNKVSLKFEIIYKDTVVYKSDILNPGTFVEWATVSHPLTAGPAKVKVDVLNGETVTQTTFVDIKIQTEDKSK